MKKRLLAVWTAATMPLGAAQLHPAKMKQTWRSPVGNERPYTSTLTVEFDHNGVVELTEPALVAMLGDAGWQRLR